MAQGKESTEKNNTMQTSYSYAKKILHRFEKYYRSISLLSHLYKVITNILTNRIKNQFKKRTEERE